MYTFCRDALAVVRRQYGFKASPRKHDHKLHDVKANDAPALEQVSDCRVVKAYNTD